MKDTRARDRTGTEPLPARAGEPPPAQSKSMHEGVAVWCDCCSCEMEPYWAEIAREMHDSGSDCGQ